MANATGHEYWSSRKFIVRLVTKPVGTAMTNAVVMSRFFTSTLLPVVVQHGSTPHSQVNEEPKPAGARGE